MHKGTLALTGGLIAFCAAWLAIAHPVPAGTPAPEPTTVPSPGARITTDGSAVVRVQPDKVTLRLGVETFAATPRESRASNALLIEAVIKAVRGQDVPAQDISTDYFSISPEYAYTGGTARNITGYRTNNTLSVSLRQVSKLSDVLTAALEAGATSVDDVSFSTSRLRELRDQARAMAVKAALQKAQGMAGAANLTPAEVLTIADNSRWYYYGWGWSSRISAAANLANMTQNVAQAALASAEAPPEDGEFSLGQIVVQAQVDLTIEAR